MIESMNTQDILKKDFLNIFEISNLFEVSAITVRRHIKNIFKEISFIEDNLKLSTPDDKALLIQKLESLSSRARKRIVGQTKAGGSMYLLELSSKEAFANWQLRPTITAVNEEYEKREQEPILHTNQVKPMITPESELTNQENDKNNQSEKEGIKSTEYVGNGTSVGFAEKYLQLLEAQLLEKDDTIKDLRETNKFLSITNGKLNEQLRLFLNKPSDSGYPK
jgi:hypothetical protein